MYAPTDVITSIDEIRDNLPAPDASQLRKKIDHIDSHISAWIARSPFLTMATHDRAGGMDISPKGDPAGFVRVLDPKTLAIPDRPGNRIYDSFANILETGRISVMFLVPNRREVVRVNGAAQIVRDAPLRESLAIKGRVPDFVILLRVEEAYFHCGKAVLRANLWEPDKAAPVDGLPSYAEAVFDQAALTDRSLADLETRFQHNETHRLYDE